VVTLAPAAGALEKALFIAIQGPGLEANVNLVLFGEDGKALCQLTSDGMTKTDLTLSPDRKWAAFVARPPVKPPRTDIVVLELATGRSANLTADFPNQADLVRQLESGAGADVVYQESPSFTPDGRRVVWVSRPLNGCANLYSANLDGSDRRAITHQEDLAKGRALYRDPDHSPVDDRIAFARLLNTKTRSLFILDAATGEERRLTEVEGTHHERPRWSPDGAWIAFMERDAEKARHWNLWVVRADGSDLRKVNAEPFPAPAACHSWLPSGDKIAFAYREGIKATTEDDEIYTIDVATGEMTAVSATPMFETYPGFLR